MRGRILLITGGRGVGKTTLCERAVGLARAAGYACAGLLTRAAPGDRRVVVDVRTGDARPLTITRGGVTVGRFRFDPAALAWGAEVLARATPCDLLVVDELGPLEVERGEGWAAALDLLRTGAFRLAFVVVRPELVDRVRQALELPPSVVVEVTPQNRDRLPAALLERLKQDFVNHESRE